MAIDLSKLSQNNEKVLIHPRDIYTALPNRPWTYLRLEQGEVLEKWFNRRGDRDVVIKQNTGGGKTVVGLLAAQSSINEGIGPVAYFASDTYLVEQVVKEATALGIHTTDNPRDPGFLSHRTILVSTLARLINGKSVFGVDGGTGTFIELGTVIVDDAHAALTAVEQQFRLTANSNEEFYKAILSLFEEDLAKQSGPILAEIRAGYSAALLRVPFWSWREKQATVVQLAVEEHKRRTAAEAARWKAGIREDKADQFLFQWPLIKDQLHLSIPTITGTYLEIQPPCPPIHKIPSYATARRRIYLTATLADDAVLVTDLDADPALIAEAVTPGRASDIGDRMILAPLELNPSLDREGIRKLAHSYANGRPGPDGIPTAEKVNVVVIVPSQKAAADWASVADRVWNVDDLKTGVRALKAGHVGLVVLANKYDGIDLAGPACRLLIIDGLPLSLDARERREASSSHKSHKSLARQVQRVEQGMGRGVRDGNDYCAVLLVGDDITHAVHDPKQRAMFSPATRVQLDISRQLAEQLHGAGWEGIYDAIDLCLERDQSWMEIGRGALARTDYNSTALIRAEEISARRAFGRAVIGDYRGAVDELQVAATAMKSPAERGWILEQKASYIDFYNAAQAQQALLAASIQNHHVLRPIAGISVERIRAASVQAAGVAAYAAESFVDGLDALLLVRQILESVHWDELRTEEAESNWEALGRLLGFGSERPEKKYNKGPDNLWALTDKQNLVFELKTGAIAQPTKKDFVDQLGGSIRWHDDEYQQYGSSAVPILVAPHPDYDRQGTPPQGTRLIGPEQLSSLKTAVFNVAVALRPRGSWSNVPMIAELLASNNLTSDRFVGAYTRTIGNPVRLT